MRMTMAKSSRSASRGPAVDDAILEMEGLRQWVLPQMEGYRSLFDAVKEQGISPRW